MAKDPVWNMVDYFDGLVAIGTFIKWHFTDDETVSIFPAETDRKYVIHTLVPFFSKWFDLGYKYNVV